MRSRPQRFTLSVRGMMILVLLFVGVMAWKVRRASIQRRAVATIKRAGGIVKYDYEIDADGDEKDDPDPWAPDWLSRAVGDEWFQEVIQVDLRDIQPRQTTLADDTLAAVAALDRVEKVEIDLPSSNAASLARLIGLTRLKSLTLGLDGTTDVWLVSLEKIRSLESPMPGWYLWRIRLASGSLISTRHA
jgi:hypothetical protein